MIFITYFRQRYTFLCRFAAAALHAPGKSHSQILLFTIGFVLLAGGLSGSIEAQMTTTYNDDRVANAVNALLVYIEGSFGALVMVCAGLGAIMSAAFGQYRAALGLLVVAVGAFILRSVMATFFNDTRLMA